MPKQQSSVMRNGEMEQALLNSEYGFTDEDILMFAEHEAELEETVANWARHDFDEAIGPLKGRAAFDVIRQAKASIPGERKTSAVPNRAPYLTYKDGVATDYDPHDPSQFWTDPDTGEMYRWDGKGERHRVVKVTHDRATGGALLPNDAAVLDAIASGSHWFHLGLGVWCVGIKQLSETTQERRDAVRVALGTRDRDAGFPIPSGRVQPVLG